MALPLHCALMRNLGVAFTEICDLEALAEDCASDNQYTFLYTAAPLGAWLVGVLAFAHSPATFWRLFAYTALFHFIRQQYGWASLYGRKARASPGERALDAAAGRAGVGVLRSLLRRRRNHRRRLRLHQLHPHRPTRPRDAQAAVRA